MRRLLSMLLVLGPATVADADECASYGLRTSLDAPLEGARVPPNARFRVLVERGACGGVPDAPEPSFRVLVGGREVASSVEPWGPHHVEIIAAAPAPPGAVELQARLPTSETELGPWTALTRVESGGALDRAAPRFRGLRSVRARALEGLAPGAPGHPLPGWELEVRLGLDAASDDATPAGALLHVVEGRRHGGDAWQLLGTFRPARARAGATFTLRRLDGWGEEWTYRVRVRDLAGHETVGARTVTARHPARPRRRLGPRP